MGTYISVERRERVALVTIDNPPMNALSTALLEELEWRVHVVRSFGEARGAIDDEHPGVLLIDPGMHVEVLERFVRGLDDRASVPGILILSDLQPAASVASEHQVVFVRAPFELDDLENALERARYSDAKPRSSRAVISRWMPDFDLRSSASFISSKEGGTPVSFNRSWMNMRSSFCFGVSMIPSSVSPLFDALTFPGTRLYKS